MEELAGMINEKIKESAIYKEYLFYREKLEKDEGLAELKNKLDEMKKLICKDKDDNMIKQYYELEKCYKSNLVVSSFLKAEEELKSLLGNIVDILSLN